MNFENHITITPDIRSGKPCIKGTRITVYDILEYLAGGMTEQEILADFPSLGREDIRMGPLPLPPPGNTGYPAHWRHETAFRRKSQLQAGRFGRAGVSRKQSYRSSENARKHR